MRCARSLWRPTAAVPRPYLPPWLALCNRTRARCGGLERRCAEEPALSDSDREVTVCGAKGGKKVSNISRCQIQKRVSVKILIKMRALDAREHAAASGALTCPLDRVFDTSPLCFYVVHWRATKQAQRQKRLVCVRGRMTYGRGTASTGWLRGSNKIWPRRNRIQLDPGDSSLRYEPPRSGV